MSQTSSTKSVALPTRLVLQLAFVRSINKALLDTDILSEVLKKRDQTVAATAQAYLAEHTRLTLSAITTLEIIYG
jgi:hypothetical protein